MEVLDAHAAASLPASTTTGGRSAGVMRREGAGGGGVSKSRGGRNGVPPPGRPPFPNCCPEAILHQGRPHRSSPVAVSRPSPSAYVRRSVRIARGGWLAPGGATRRPRWPPSGPPVCCHMDSPRVLGQRTNTTPHSRRGKASAPILVRRRGRWGGAGVARGAARPDWQ